MSGSVPLIYAYLAATAAEMVGQNEQRQDRRRILNASLADTENTQRDAVQQVQREAEQLSPQARMRQMADAERMVYDRAMADIQGAGGAAVDTAGGAGAVSSDFTRALEGRRSAEGERLSAIASELAKVRAPQDVATEAAMRRGAMSEQIGSMWNSLRGRADAARLDAEAVEQPLYGQLAGLVKTGIGAYGTGGMGGAGLGVLSKSTANDSSANSRAAKESWYMRGRR